MPMPSACHQVSTLSTCACCLDHECAACCTSLRVSLPYILTVSSQAAAAPGTVTVKALKGSNSPPVTPSSLAFCTQHSQLSQVTQCSKAYEKAHQRAPCILSCPAVCSHNSYHGAILLDQSHATILLRTGKPDKPEGICCAA